MTYSQDCYDLAAISEGMKTAAYRDPVGIWTIGYGHTGPEVVEGLVWTPEQCMLQLGADLQIACEQMERIVAVRLTQGQTDALTDFTFNMGIGRLHDSTLLKRLNQGEYSSVPYELYHVDPDGTQHGWVFAGGVVLPGLVTRRLAEIDLWLKV
jgi:lysozyme